MLYRLWVISDFVLRTQSRPLGGTLTTRSPAQHQHLSKRVDLGPAPVRPSAELAEEVSLTTSIRRSAMVE